jgi:hypothetical protein
LTEQIRVAHGLMRAASAFLATVFRRPLETVTVKEIGVKTAVVAAPNQPNAVKAPDPPRAVLSEGLAATAGIENKCPVCQARFRGARLCSRCGAHLEPLMRLTVKAWQLRQAARQALDDGDAGRALGFAMEAEGTQSTERGEALRLLSAWLR